MGATTGRTNASFWSGPTRHVWWDIRYNLRELWSRTVGMRLAQFIDRHTTVCWADICSDLGIGHRIFRTYSRSPCGAFQSKQSDMGRADVQHCWCGKSYDMEPPA